MKKAVSVTRRLQPEQRTYLWCVHTPEPGDKREMGRRELKFEKVTDVGKMESKVKTE